MNANGCKAVSDPFVVHMETAPKVPCHAASTNTWSYGSQTWSDAIHIPACNKPSFTESYTDPHCRSYTSGTNTWYYYDWPYVNQNAATLCPSPWRVPTSSDFSTLVSATNYSTLINAWGYGGYAYGSYGSSMADVSMRAYYWSSTQYNTNDAYTLHYVSGGLNVTSVNKYYGFQVRCVK
jgi:uncharacterized protein (TIGR02145 family)